MAEPDRMASRWVRAGQGGKRARLKPYRIGSVTSLHRIGSVCEPDEQLQRYFFDVEDGEHRHQDGQGLEFFDLTGAIEEAHLILRSLADLDRFTGHPHISTVRVRSADGDQVYEGSTTLGEN